MTVTDINEARRRREALAQLGTVEDGRAILEEIVQDVDRWLEFDDAYLAHLFACPVCNALEAHPCRPSKGEHAYVVHLPRRALARDVRADADAFTNHLRTLGYLRRDRTAAQWVETLRINRAVAELARDPERLRAALERFKSEEASR